MKKREAIENAKLAFWAEIARAYPEAKYGDVDHGVLIEFDATVERTVDHWIEMNVTGSEA